jgi:predicted DNA-binding WGR domain protein
MQRYEFNDGKSSKFWQIEQQGTDLHISWGKIGTSGQSQVKAFDTEAKATAAKDKLVKEKTGKGYAAAGEAPMAAGATPKLKAEPKTQPKAQAADDGDDASPAAAKVGQSAGKPASKSTDKSTDKQAKASAADEAGERDGAGDKATPARSDDAAAKLAPAATQTAAAPAPAAPIPSLQAPREAIDAWLAQRRDAPGVDERAQQAWPRVLQVIAEAGQNQAGKNLTVNQVQRAAQVDDDALHLIDGWLVDAGLSYGYGFDAFRWIDEGKRVKAAQVQASAQAELPERLAQLAQARAAAWAPVAASEPDAAWPARFGQRQLASGGASTWPMRSDGPHAKPSERSATEAWYLLRKGVPERFNAASSDASLRDAIDQLDQRLNTEAKAVPDEASDHILLAMCVHMTRHHGSRLHAGLPNIVTYLVQAHGLAKLVHMLAAAAQLQGGYDYRSKQWSLHPASAGHGHLFYAPSETLFALLRSWLLAADEAEWQAAVAAAVAVMPSVPADQRAWLGLLLTDAPEVARAALHSHSGKPPESALWLLAALPLGDEGSAERADVRSLLGIKPDPDQRYSLYTTPHLLAPVVHKLRDEALGFLANAVGHAGIANQLAAINEPEAIVALAKQASAHKDNQARLKLALARWPLAGAAGLARLCAQGGKDTPLLLPQLRQALSELGPALALLPAWLTPAARDFVAQLLARQSAVIDTASADALPPVLQNPPWLQAKKRAAAKAMALAPLTVADASSGERPPLGQWEKKHLADAIAKPKTDALALAEELRVQYRYRGSKQQFAYLQALAVAIRQRNADALIAAWEAGVEEERQFTTNYFSPRFDGLACVALPDDLGLPLWNAKAGSVSYTYNQNEVLTHWGLAALPGFLRILRANPSGQFDEAQHWGSAEIAPIAARAAFKLKSLKKAGQRWLLRWPEHAMAGLIAPALGKPGEARDMAAKSLRFLSAKGHHALLMRMAARYDDPAVPKAVQAVLDEDPLDLYPSKIAALPDLWQPQSWARPMLKTGGALGDDAMTALGQMMAFPRNDGLYEGLPQVVQACTPDTLAEFGWEMFSAWLASGAPSKDNWMFSSLAFLGNDEVARRLTPLIRTWPGEAAHARAVAGLDVLEGIGTDTALMLLNGIAQKVKFKGLQDKAREKIAAIAEARGLSTEELEDRLAPDLGLDERGSLVLDFGPRQFKVGFDEALKPWVRDFTDGKDGARLKDLPKPIKSDDEAQAKDASERYKLLKKDAKTIAAQQIQRLEVAMCQQRRWTAENFRDFIATHPLVRHIAQRLIWGVYAVDGVADDEGGEGSDGDSGALRYPNFGGQLQACFRLAEDGSLTTADDEPYALPTEAKAGQALRIGIPHALQLPVQDAQAFGQLFADYELLQPFAQVGRDTYALTEAEAQTKLLSRWKGKKVPTGRILGLANKAWRKGDAQDGGGIWYFNKPLVDDRVVEMNFEPGITVGMVDEEPEQVIGELSVGVSSRWGGIGQDEQLTWQVLDAISASELIRDMEALTAP